MNQVLSKHCMPMILLIQLTVTFMVYIQCTTTKDITQTLHMLFIGELQLFKKLSLVRLLSHGVLFLVSLIFISLVVQIQKMLSNNMFLKLVYLLCNHTGHWVTINVDGVTTLLNPLKLLLKISKI